MELDTLVIDVSANTAKATKNIQNLTSKIRELRNIFKSVNTGKDSLAPLYEGLKSIASLDFSKSIDGLREISSILKSLETKNFKSLDKIGSLSGAKTTEEGASSSGDVGITKLVGNSNLYNALNNTKDFGIALNECSDEIRDMERVSSFFVELSSNIGKSVEETQKLYEDIAQLVNTKGQLDTIINSLQKINEELSAEQLAGIEERLLSLGYTADQTAEIMKRLGKEVEDSGNKANKARSKFSKFLQSLKRIAVYRLIRRALQIVVNSLKEGIENVSKFDEATSKAVSNIKSSWVYLKNSLGTFLYPIIQMAEPLIVSLLDGIANAFNLIGEYMSAINGQDTFAKATKSAEEYAESLKKASNASMGIDELNVLSTSQDTEGMYEQVKISEEVKQNAEEYKEGVRVIGELVSDIFKVVGKIVVALSPLLKSISNLIYSLEPLLDFIVDVLNNVVVPIIDYAVVNIQGIVDILSNQFESAFTIIKDFFAMFKALLTGNADLATKLGKKVVADIINFFIGLGENFINAIINCINKKTSGLSGLWTWLGIPEIPDIPNVSFGRVAFAKGGFPEDGLFFANSNELVGKFSNGKTAVANNDQIIEGIKQGVMEAIIESGGNGTNVVVYLDSNEISSRVEENINRKSAGIYKGAM